MSTEQAVTPQDFYERILWGMAKKKVSWNMLGEALNISTWELISRVKGENLLSTLQLAQICERLNLHTDALLQPTWDLFIERQTGVFAELDELKLLLLDLGYEADFDTTRQAERLLGEAATAYADGNISIRVLLRFVDLLRLHINMDENRHEHEQEAEMKTRLIALAYIENLRAKEVLTNE